MERRELLKMIAVLTGATVVGGNLFLSSCTSNDKDGGSTAKKAKVPEAPPKPPFLAAADMALLDEVGETIIPATNTPGAKAAAIGAFMSVMVGDCYTKAQQDAFIKGMATLNEACKKKYTKTFMECDAKQRHDFLVSLEKEAKVFNKALDKKEKPQRDAAQKAGKEFEGEPVHYYTMMKQLTLFGFFTSKTGMTETLRHEPVPGRYDGAMAYNKGDKAWAE
jgi:Gluconate 2-dehydrogenase subunit 3